jgi:Domain of unknown function (DUF5134)
VTGITRCDGFGSRPVGGGVAVPVTTLWSCVIVLLALAARSGARLLSDRARTDPSEPACTLTSRTGDVMHLAMAGGMVAMIMPLGFPPLALAALFSATTAVTAGTWLQRAWRRRLAISRGGVVPCRPAHALEPHHLIVGLTMISMVARPTRSASMADMTGMTSMAASASWFGLGTVSLIYVWAAVVVLGGGLVKAVTTQPVPDGAVAILAAPVTVYACELAMTVVMGLMLLG